MRTERLQSPVQKHSHAFFVAFLLVALILSCRMDHELKEKRSSRSEGGEGDFTRAFAACLLLLHRFLKCNESSKMNYGKKSLALPVVLCR